MSYQKHTWVTNEIIRGKNLNHIEDGIYQEQQRSIEAESVLRESVDEERTRAQIQETTLNTKIVQNTNAITTLNADSSTPGSVDYKIAHSGSGGHVIVDSDGIPYPQRSSLKFNNSTISDDSVNNQTVITPEGSAPDNLIAGDGIVITKVASDSTIATDNMTASDMDDVVTYGNTGEAQTGFTPVGTIISYMGNTAPQYYLKCDGTVYNISTYPQLAEHIKTQFGSYDKFGGDGVTTFAVPDLQGEFLRGTGTNSHLADTGRYEGAGANVGEHQGSTKIPWVYQGSDSNHIRFMGQCRSAAVTSPARVDAVSADSAYGFQTTQQAIAATWSVVGSATWYTPRPTNTSVLFCIAYQDIYIYRNVVKQDVYSLDEKVIGTWYNGKPIYEKVIETTTPSTGNSSFPSNANSVAVNIGALVDTIVKIDAFAYTSGGVIMFSNSPLASTEYIEVWGRNNSHASLPNTIGLACGSAWISKPCIITVQYTKTTDTTS